MSKTAWVAVLSFSWVHLATAHAFLDHADPKVGSALRDPPAQVSVWMTENLEGAFSRLRVFDDHGIEVDKKDTQVKGAVMTVSLPRLPPGSYHVAWEAVATDTHKTSGTFDFTIQ